MTQQIEVAAAHQFQAAAAQADGPVTDIVGLPARPGWNAGVTDQALCDDAIGVAGKAAIERAENKPEPLTLSQRQTVRPPARGPARGKAPEAQRRIGTRNEIGIERDDGGCRRRRVSAIDEDDRQTVTTVLNEPVLAVGGQARKCQRHGSDRARVERLRRRGDQNRGGIEMRRPNDRGAMCR
jgi:hypothetical protein